MAKLYFRYSTMNAGKSMDLISTHFNYKELGKHPMAFLPAIAGSTIRSRVGCEIDAKPFAPSFDFYEAWERKDLDFDCILIDEAQFLTPLQVRQLHKVAVLKNIPVICYGLRTDFTGELFEGSGLLMALADHLQEIPTLCHCGKKARMVLRTSHGQVVMQGERIAIKGQEETIAYHSVCAAHFYQEKFQ